MSVYVGIDVHRKRSQVAVVSEDGTVKLNKNVVNGSEPMLRDHFFERVRPIVEKALREDDRARWPLVAGAVSVDQGVGHADDFAQRGRILPARYGWTGPLRA